MVEEKKGLAIASIVLGALFFIPLAPIVGLILGIVVAFYGVYAMLRPFIGDKQNKGNG